ncbi:polysaccharide pyruvyl transferase family protein [Planktothrix sp. FACHB-1365]|uniref:polysaccharide pyruvyl transferase family protein n=1 Tax=Planktothrix sp. FACHB-1365 TaxID=2692855 RepID=UPI001684D1B4|nr:polysaccharide pyruvyl transferase family protein [Planktothrix sp. FACHB-1365]MBD2480627.1 polysaccharide pyruvyl transferase family protein [Planktothrix sp. FACHB-1365]
MLQTSNLIADLTWKILRRANNAKLKTLNPLHRKFFLDRRCKFYDLSQIPSQQRVARSPILQFYSSVDNIGNYLPVLGIQKMLNLTTDTWNAYDQNIDFDFINTHYKGIIIGGAGLLYRSFNRFWEQVLIGCKIPLIIWGVGVCLPDGEKDAGADIKILKKIVSRCDLMNVRDDVTADYYNFPNASIAPCPTIAYLDGFRSQMNLGNYQVLFSSHDGLVSAEENKELMKVVIRVTPKFEYTDNIQYPCLGLEDIITQSYMNSRVVVTTRLHGAIIAYGLGIPYLAIPRDEKLRDFYRLYGNGLTVQNVQELEEALKQGWLPELHPIALKPVLEFGKKAQQWVTACCSN